MTDPEELARALAAVGDALDAIGLRPLPVLGAEDVVLQKLRWYEMGGRVSDRQWRDVVAVLRASAPMDAAYLDAVAGPEGLAELLEAARRDATS